nr:probable magnesium transporter NIPA8 isoform X1 [Ipomoea batatas]
MPPPTPSYGLQRLSHQPPTTPPPSSPLPQVSSAAATAVSANSIHRCCRSPNTQIQNNEFVLAAFHHIRLRFMQLKKSLARNTAQMRTTGCSMVYSCGSLFDSPVPNGKATMKPIIHFQTWRIGILFFALGNCLNFISFGFAAQFPFLDQLSSPSSRVSQVVDIGSSRGGSTVGPSTRRIRKVSPVTSVGFVDSSDVPDRLF